MKEIKRPKCGNNQLIKDLEPRVEKYKKLSSRADKMASGGYDKYRMDFLTIDD